MRHQRKMRFSFVCNKLNFFFFLFFFLSTSTEKNKIHTQIACSRIKTAETDNKYSLSNYIISNFKKRNNNVAPCDHHTGSVEKIMTLEKQKRKAAQKVFFFSFQVRHQKKRWKYKKLYRIKSKRWWWYEPIQSQCDISMGNASPKYAVL